MMSLREFALATLLLGVSVPAWRTDGGALGAQPLEVPDPNGAEWASGIRLPIEIPIVIVNFWGKFVGSDISHRMVPVNMPDGRQVYRCGWTHYAPNSERDYDWANARRVETDIEDWQPEGIGRTRTINCERWQGNDVQWKIYWMQNIPGAGNHVKFNGRALTNWWLFKGDWDYAMRTGIGLVKR